MSFKIFTQKKNSGKKKGIIKLMLLRWQGSFFDKAKKKGLEVHPFVLVFKWLEEQNYRIFEGLESSDLLKRLLYLFFLGS